MTIGKWRQVKKLTSKQKLAANLLVLGLKITQIAKILHVRRETIWAWKKQPRFAALVGKLQAECDAHIRRLMLPLMEKVMDQLERMLDSSNVREEIFAVDTLLRLNGLLPWEPKRRRRA